MSCFPARSASAGFSLFIVTLLTACGGSSSGSKDAQPYEVQASEEFPGGLTSVERLTDDQAFSIASRNLVSTAFDDFVGFARFERGDDVFNDARVEAPGAPGQRRRDGLGPLFNLSSCQGCHILDGRGHSPAADGEYEHAPSMLIRLSIPSDDPRVAMADLQSFQNGEIPVIPHPVYGGQFQDRSVSGFAEHTYPANSVTLTGTGQSIAGQTVGTGEGDIRVTWMPASFTYPDQTRKALRFPRFELTNLQFGDLGEFEMSPRISPQMIGLGLIEAITADVILERADENDADNDGISGKANYNNGVLGRFGWKAGNATLMAQNTGAFAGDIGITSSFAQATDCTDAENNCQQLENNGFTTDPAPSGFELYDEDAVTMEFYTQHLSVPRRTEFDSETARAGKRLFFEAGCESCHRATVVTGEHASPALSGQTIWPYTDVLLHDMGTQLADNRPEFRATGTEWRTAPLWGVGLTAQVVGQRNTQFLHDGRAADIEEAILWHGCVAGVDNCMAGEAEAARDRFAALTAAERQQLIHFINTL